MPTAAASTRIQVKAGVTTALEFRESGVGSILVDPSLTLTASGATATKQTVSFTVQQQDNKYTDFTLLKFPALPTDLNTITVNGQTYTARITGGYAVPLGGDATPVIKEATAEVITSTITGTVDAGDIYSIVVDANPAVTYTVLATDTLSSIAAGLAAAYNADAASSAIGTATVVGNAVVVTATEIQRGRSLSLVAANPTDVGTLDGTITAVTTTANVAPSAITTVAEFVTAMEISIEGRDSVLATTGTRVRALAVGGSTVDTLYIQTVNNDTNDIDFSGLSAASRPTDGDGTAYTSTTISVSTAKGFEFSSTGLTINAQSLEILGFTSGADNMSNATGEGKRIALDFSKMTQFGDEFSADKTSQNGSKFGTFSGVTISEDGLVTALFDNGETRKIAKIPIATFTNPNQLEAKSGNVWSATQNSGDYTLRVADSGRAGQVIQSALEASTVDIGAEFTNMIVVQRAYSASTKIITTADQMLEELMRTK